MRIAVVGSGIAGLVSAWLLSRRHEVVLFEAAPRLGGHTHTHDVQLHGRHYAVDSGFIVHNRDNYPLLSRLFAELGVETRPTTMGFSVHGEASGLEYSATSLDALFCQRRNLLSPRFLGMLRDLLRFYRVAPQLLEDDGPGPTLDEYLRQQRFGDAFRDEHLLPMTCALWSSPAAQVLQFPARALVQFMANHQMLTVGERPQWRVVAGGSRRYVEAMRSSWTAEVRLACPVLAVQRHAGHALVRSPAGSERYDAVVLACHSDESLRLLDDPDRREREILGAIGFQHNEAVLHTDARLLPRRRKAWAAWNAWVPRDASAGCTVTYCMNLLQGLDAPEPLLVTLNRGDAIDPARVLARMRYAHPVHTHAALAAQARQAEIQGRRHTWYAGAWWGWGFHEDGIRSAVAVAESLGAPWDPPAAGAKTARAADLQPA